MKQKIKWFFEMMHESKTLRYIQIGLNVMVFASLLYSGIVLIQLVNTILGSLILLIAAMYLALNKIDK